VSRRGRVRNGWLAMAGRGIVSHEVDGDKLVTWPSRRHFWVHPTDYAPFKSRADMVAAHNATVLQFAAEHPAGRVYLNTGPDFIRRFPRTPSALVVVSRSDLERNMKARAAALKGGAGYQPMDAASSFHSQTEMRAEAVKHGIPLLKGFSDPLLPNIYGLVIATSGAGKSHYIEAGLTRASAVPPAAPVFSDVYGDLLAEQTWRATRSEAEWLRDASWNPVTGALIDVGDPDDEHYACGLADDRMQNLIMRSLPARDLAAVQDQLAAVEGQVVLNRVVATWPLPPCRPERRSRPVESQATVTLPATSPCALKKPGEAYAPPTTMAALAQLRKSHGPEAVLKATQVGDGSLEAWNAGFGNISMVEYLTAGMHQGCPDNPSVAAAQPTEHVFASNAHSNVMHSAKATRWAAQSAAIAKVAQPGTGGAIPLELLSHALHAHSRNPRASAQPPYLLGGMRQVAGYPELSPDRKVALARRLPWFVDGADGANFMKLIDDGVIMPGMSVHACTGQWEGHRFVHARPSGSHEVDGDKLVTWPTRRHFWIEPTDYTPFANHTAMLVAHNATVLEFARRHPTGRVFLNTGSDFISLFPRTPAALVVVTRSDLERNIAARIAALKGAEGNQCESVDHTLLNQSEMRDEATLHGILVLDGFSDPRLSTTYGLIIATSGAGKSHHVANAKRVGGHVPWLTADDEPDVSAAHLRRRVIRTVVDAKGEEWALLANDELLYDAYSRSVWRATEGMPDSIMHVAAFHGRPRVVAMLLASGVCPNATNGRGLTAAMTASLSPHALDPGHVEVVRMLETASQGGYNFSSNFARTTHAQRAERGGTAQVTTSLAAWMGWRTREHRAQDLHNNQAANPSRPFPSGPGVAFVAMTSGGGKTTFKGAFGKDFLALNIRIFDVDDVEKKYMTAATRDLLYKLRGEAIIASRLPWDAAMPNPWQAYIDYRLSLNAKDFKVDIQAEFASQVSAGMLIVILTHGLDDAGYLRQLFEAASPDDYYLIGATTQAPPGVLKGRRLEASKINRANALDNPMTLDLHVEDAWRIIAARIIARAGLLTDLKP